MKPARMAWVVVGVGAALAGRSIWARIREADLTGQVVLITGGSRGLGLALAQEFAAQGCRLALCARDEAELARAQKQLVGQGANVLTVPCDLRDPEQATRLIEAVTEHYGRIDILVNNAGIIGVGPLDDMTVQDFEDAMQTDFWGTLYPTFAVLPQMRARKNGRIVNITSIGGKVSVPHLLPYSCAKFAATGFSEGLRAELACHNIVVTTIAPGLMRTGSFLHALFAGRQPSEYAWFSVSDNIPGVSLGAARAARQIVQATRRGEAERMLGLPAKLAAGFHGLFPGLTSDASGVINRMLPPPGGADGGQTKPGAQVRAENPSAVRDGLTGLGFRAADKLNER